MTDQSSLDSVLTGEATTTVDAEPTGEPEAKATEAATPAAQPKTEDKPKDEPWHVKAVAEERRKRQALEQEMDALRKETEALRTPKQKPNLFEDPDNWEKHLDETVKREIASVRQESESRFLALCEAAARSRHTDFEEVVGVFAEAAKSTPGLAEEARRAADPAEFIYQAGLNLKRVREAGSIEALIEKAREEGRQEALKGKSVPKIPESLTDIAGGKGETGKTWSGPKPLTEIIPNH